MKTPWSCLECDDGIIEEEEKETIECHRYKNWCHKQCSMLSEAQYAVFARGGEGGGGGELVVAMPEMYCGGSRGK